MFEKSIQFSWYACNTNGSESRKTPLNYTNFQVLWTSMNYVL